VTTQFQLINIIINGYVPEIEPWPLTELSRLTVGHFLMLGSF
jgi:hypothetical protein